MWSTPRDYSPDHGTRPWEWEFGPWELGPIAGVYRCFTSPFSSYYAPISTHTNCNDSSTTKIYIPHLSGPLCVDTELWEGEQMSSCLLFFKSYFIYGPGPVFCPGAQDRGVPHIYLTLILILHFFVTPWNFLKSRIIFELLSDSSLISISPLINSLKI